MRIVFISNYIFATVRSVGLELPEPRAARAASPKWATRAVHSSLRRSNLEWRVTNKFGYYVYLATQRAQSSRGSSHPQPWGNSSESKKVSAPKSGLKLQGQVRCSTRKHLLTKHRDVRKIDRKSYRLRESRVHTPSDRVHATLSPLQPLIIVDRIARRARNLDSGQQWANYRYPFLISFEAVSFPPLRSVNSPSPPV